MTIIVKDSGLRKLEFDEGRLIRFVDAIAKGINDIDMDDYKRSLLNSVTSKEEMTADALTNEIVLKATERIDEAEPNWTFFAAKVYAKTLYKKAANNRSYDASKKYGSFYGLLKTLGSKGIYKADLLAKYSEKEIEKFGKMIDSERDSLFTYIGIKTLADRYLTKDYDGNIFELPQERWMIIAMTLMINEPKNHREKYIKEAYWALSNLYMTTATPTLANAGKTVGQLSSCFIDTVDDSLDGIMMNNMDVARLSKDGGGLGVYLGKIRARGSDIKKFKGKSSGVIPWMKQLNTIAVNVDQLGQRQGAIAVYLDVWHKDIMGHSLDVKTQNGDERLELTIFSQELHSRCIHGTSKNRNEWYLFDPHK